MKSKTTPTIVLAAVLLSFSPIANAQSVILPELNGPTSGNNLILNSQELSMQIAFDSSQFEDIPIGSAITGMAFRLSPDVSTSWPSSSMTWDNYDIQFGTSLNPLSTDNFPFPSISMTYADNMGGDTVTVRSGSLTFSPGDFPFDSPTGTPNSFGPEIGFSTPYIYSGGDLLITIRHTGNGVDHEFMDYTHWAVGPTQSIYSHPYQGGYAATTAGAWSFGSPIIRLSYGVVPEPSGALLVCMTGTLALLRRRSSL